MEAEWSADRALTNLSFEKALIDLGSPQDQAKKLFEEALPLVAMSICHLATRSDSEAIRFNAGKYVVERTMGPAEKQNANEGGRHAWDDIYDDVVEDVVNKAEGYANGS